LKGKERDGMKVVGSGTMKDECMVEIELKGMGKNKV